VGAAIVDVPAQLKSQLSPADLLGERPKNSGNFRENNMNAKFSIVLATALLISACASSPQSLIVGKWEVENAPLKMTAEFSGDGTAKITMFGQTVQGKYKVDDENQLEWTVNGITTKSKVIVTATEMELTNSENQTIKYQRK
jgi:hypothetical protein